jgi:hypothetical protein
MTFHFQFPIERGVPVPPLGRQLVRKYPFCAMKVGDSFFVPGQTSVKGSARVAAATYGRRNNMRFTGRTVTQDGISGLRIWRVK